MCVVDIKVSHNKVFFCEASAVSKTCGDIYSVLQPFNFFILLSVKYTKAFFSSLSPRIMPVRFGAEGVVKVYTGYVKLP